MVHRTSLELIWRAGVERVSGHTSVLAALNGMTISKPDAIVAIGKAATPMLEAALAFCGYDTKSLLVTKYDHVVCHHHANLARLQEYRLDGTLQIIESGHPVPDENSLVAGLALSRFVGALDDPCHLLVLVSGGASALGELLPQNLNLKALQKETDKMLGDGLAIGEINRRRKELSMIKDGKLLANFSGKQITVLAISDVQGDEIAVIGSGIAMTNKVADHIQVKSQIVASNKIARDACVKKAELIGYKICENAETAYGDVEEVARNIAGQIIGGADGVYIFGGEPTLVLPQNPGRGGRNQHLALLLAKKIAGLNNIEILVAGSDGSDGPGNAAGGFADGNSFGEGAQIALDCADSGSFWERSGNLFVTGPTGTNVMDLIVVVKG